MRTTKNPVCLTGKKTTLHLQHTFFVHFFAVVVGIAWENSRHLATLLLVSPPNDVCETSAKTPYWWRVTTQISGSASYWLNQISHAARPIRSTTQIWVVTRHQYGISALVSQTSFGGETTGSVAKCRLLSQAVVGTTTWNFLVHL